MGGGEGVGIHTRRSAVPPGNEHSAANFSVRGRSPTQTGRIERSFRGIIRVSDHIAVAAEAVVVVEYFLQERAKLEYLPTGHPHQRAVAIFNGYFELCI